MSDEAIVALVGVGFTVAIAVVGFLVQATRRSVDDLKELSVARLNAIEGTIAASRSEFDRHISRLTAVTETLIGHDREAATQAARIEERLTHLGSARADQDKILSGLVDELRSTIESLRGATNSIAEFRQLLSSAQARLQALERSSGKRGEV